MSVEKKSRHSFFILKNKIKFYKRSSTTMKNIQNAIKSLQRRYCLEILRS